MNEKKVEFSDRLKELVAIKDMTQRDFAEAVGLSAPTLSSYLRGQKKPSLDTLINIANVYGVSIDWLCGLTDEQQSGGEVKTYSDVIKRLFEIERAGIEYLSIAYIHEPPEIYGVKNPNTSYGELKIDDEYLCVFFKNWEGMKKLHDQKTIDDNLYQLWINQQLERYKFSLYDKEEQIEISRMEEEEDGR